MISEEIKKLEQAILVSNKVLLVIHRKPDGDAIGSMLAIKHYLSDLKKQTLCFCIDPIPEHFNYIKEAEYVESNSDKVKNQEFDLCIILDCGDPGMSKIQETLNNKNFVNGIVNIDHHATNNNYGDINIVIPKASSTSEIVYLIFKTLKYKINPNIATCLLTGILTDTNNFTNGGTTQQSIESASELLKIGANINQILNANVFNKTIDILKLWGEVLKRIAYNKELNMVITAVFAEDIKKFNLENEEATEGISNYLNNLSKEIKCSLVLKDNGLGKVRGSLRTTREDVDVSKIALLLGGGGHKKAAGFEVSGKLVFNNNIWQIKQL
ncbi:MAG TPA: bifunctional oligoribonuclease/PAP phosphatase NrnA [bacterium]|jgi:phosphoesterase RecJ-like protein|nr:bifunctional oligoribonuclease/PAP phosphatase NrnA [bacterium]HOG38386.1 bifunctional oligoribonuclease/PAP phosphatase NrnA [bacterium]HQI03344.1 bifunctional oligoribonuclease/PAP phosphatase NrnA [bacterium]